MESTFGAKSVSWLPVAHLVESARNARLHSESQVGKIAASIGRFGFNAPVLVDAAMEIIAGHGRVLAARRLGMESVPVISLEHLSEAEARAYRLADNRLSELSDWDQDALRCEVSALLQDFDLSDFGFSDADKILARTVDPTSLAADALVEQADADEAPAIEEKTVSRIGDIWVLGEHRLACGDSTDPTCLERCMDGRVADLLFTDPPYGVSYASKVHGGIMNDDRRGAGLVRMLEGALRSALSQMTERASVYVCFPWRTYLQFWQAFERCGLSPDNCIVWDKLAIGLGAAKYRPQHEMILFCDRGGWAGDRAQSDVWTLPRENVANYVHPTQKPVAIVERALRNSTRHGEVVLDLFAGSGTTVIAAERLGRVARVIDLDPRFADVIVRRWQNFTGRAAVLAENGATFGRVSQER